MRKIFTAARILSLTALALLCALPASAATKVRLGYTPVPETVGAYAAKEENYFAKRGLDVDFQLVSSSAVLVTSLVAQSADIGSITPAVFLQAVDGGLDLVIIAGGAVSTRAQHTSGILGRTGTNLKSPADFVGKKVAVVALRSALHIQFTRWLSDNNVDPKKVTFVEAPYVTHLDLLRGGSVDAVVNSDPFITRIVSAKSGYLVTYLSDRLPEATATVIYVATRDWAKAHPDAVKAFKASVADGVTFTGTNTEKAKTYIGKYLKLPPDAVQATAVGKLQASFIPSQLQWWIDTMKAQRLIRSSINPVPLVVQ